jgi:glycosyltransferase involved in cell wall biosynthesis
MKIVIAHESVGTEGGVETYLLSVIRRLCRRGHQVGLLYHRRNDQPGPLLSSAHISFGVEERGLATVIADLGRWQPAVVFSHNMGPLDVDRQLLAHWPVVKMFHGYFGTCVSGLKMHAFPSARVCDRTFGPACLGLYVPRRCGQLSPGALIGGYRWAASQRSLFPRYAAVVVASGHMRDEMARNGVPPGKLRVLPLFSTLDSTRTPAVPGEPVAAAPEPDTVLFAGRMTPLKGGHVLIAAAARASRALGRPVRILMAGDGPQKEAWRALAATLDVGIELTGWVAPEDRARVYARGQLVAVPSLWPEPFGLAGLDAATLGRPAIAFDVGGISDWLTDGLNGRLVDPDRGEQGLGEAIASILGDPAERARMGREALGVSQRMSVTAHVERLERVLADAAPA